MKRRDFMRWAGTLGVTAITADALKAFGTDDQVLDEKPLTEPVGTAADEPYIPDEWYFATWRVPLLCDHPAECTKCGAQARYWYSRHNRVGKEVNVYKCSACGQSAEYFAH